MNSACILNIATIGQALKLDSYSNTFYTVHNKIELALSKYRKTLLIFYFNTTEKQVWLKKV